MHVKFVSLTLLLVGLVCLSVQNGNGQSDTTQARVLWTRIIEEAFYCPEDMSVFRLNFALSCLDREGGTLVLLSNSQCEYPRPIHFEVRKFDALGAHRWTYGNINSGNEALSYGIASDMRGNVYVTEEHSPVWSLDPMYNLGTKLVSISGSGAFRWSDLYTGPTEKTLALGPALVAAADSLHVYVVSWDHSAVQLLVYSQSGAGPHITDILPNDIPELVRIAPNGDVILVGDYVHRYSFNRGTAFPLHSSGATNLCGHGCRR